MHNYITSFLSKKEYPFYDIHYNLCIRYSDFRPNKTNLPILKYTYHTAIMEVTIINRITNTGCTAIFLLFILYLQLLLCYTIVAFE